MDQDTGQVHYVEVTGANMHDVTVVPWLLTGEENAFYGDSGYLGAEKREDAVTRNQLHKKIQYKISRRQSKNRKCPIRSQTQLKRGA